MRKILIALILLLAVFLVITRFTEVNQIAETLRRGDWRFVVLAIAVEVLWLLNMGASFQAVYRILGMDEKLLDMFRMAAAASFVNSVAPSGGVSGLAIFVNNARRQGKPVARVMVAGAIYLMFEYTGFLAVLTVGLAVLARRNNLHATEVIASLILLAIALGLGALLFLAMESSERLGKVLAWMARLVNRALHPFIRRQYLSEERAHSFAREVADGITALKASPRNMIKPFLLALSSKSLLIVIMMLSFFAFKVPLSVGTLIAGFSIGYLFVYISPTPSGVGIVEGILTLTLTSMYVDVEDATVVMLTYRGITFWLMLLFGLVAFRSYSRLVNLNKVEVN